MRTIYQMDLLDGISNSLQPLDFLILSSGSDTRACEVLNKYASKNLKIETVIVINYKERLADTKYTDTLFSYKSFEGYNIMEIECNIKDPSSSLQGLLAIPFNSTNSIGVDISYLTKPHLFFILKFLKERFSVESLLVFYTEPKTYLFTKGLFDTFKTSSGPLSISEIQGFSGQKDRGAKTILIILLGFDGGLSKEINEDVSPNQTFVINGFPSYTPKFKDISLITNEKLVSDKNIQVRYSKANSPFDIYNLLEEIKNLEGNVFINIAPLGTKPMALGACMFALHNPDVRIIYPLPDSYESKYTDMSWNTWQYVFPMN
jgi:hypothetical protein